MQRKGKLLFLVVGLGLLIGLALPACGPTPVSNSNQPQRGGTITDGLYEEPDVLLSNGSNLTYSILVDATIWAPLVYGDDKGVIHPGLLKELPTVANGEISSDALHYTLKLKDNLKWSDGQPLTAEDVVFTMNLWNTPAYGAKGGTAGLASIDFSTLKAVDATTVTFSMKNVYVPLIASQFADPGLAPMPKHVFGTMDPSTILKSTEAFKPTVVSGPFKISDRVKGDHINVVRNDNYFQAAQGYPYLDGINFKIIPDASTVLTALQSHSLDTSWFLDNTKLDSYKALQGYKLYLPTQPVNTEWITFNLHDPILADLQVRKAISTALDIDSMIKQAVNGVGIRTCDEDLGTFAHEPDVTCYPFDQATAKSVLDADGWAMGSDGYRHKNGKILELNWSTTSNNARRAQTQQIGQQNLKDIGIKINIKDFPADALFGTILPSGQYQIGEFTNSLGYDPDDFTSWGCNQTAAQGGGNWTYYCNQAVDAALHAEQQNPDQNARLEQFKIFHQAMLTDLPVVYVYSYGAPAVAGNNVHNYNPSAQGPSETWNVWTWYKS